MKRVSERSEGFKEGCEFVLENLDNFLGSAIEEAVALSHAAAFSVVRRQVRRYQEIVRLDTLLRRKWGVCEEAVSANSSIVDIPRETLERLTKCEYPSDVPSRYIRMMASALLQGGVADD